MKIIFKCINGKKIGIEKKYAENSVLINICEYINDKKMEKQKNIMIMVNYHLKVNIWMEKEKNIIKMMKY